MNKSFLPALVLPWFLFGNAAVADPATTIGVSAPMTGNAATYGVDLKNALEFANQKLANSKYTFDFQDDKCDGKSAATVAKQFTAVSDIRYVLGLPCSGALMAAAPIYEKSKAIVVASGASAISISSAGDYIFRTWVSDAEVTKLLSKMVSPKHKRLAMLSEQTEYCQGLADSLGSWLKDSPVKVFSESFVTDTPDFRSVLAKFKSQRVDAIFLNTQTEATFLAALKQIKEANWDVQIYSAYMAASAALREKAGRDADGIIVVDLPTIDEAATTDGKTAIEEFTAKYGKAQSWDMLVIIAMEAFRALHVSIEKAAAEGKPVIETITSASFEGYIGPWKFDQNGDIVGPLPVLRTINNGKLSVVTP
jgi:branched-chain amino acid transport system substrate-binding protein